MKKSILNVICLLLVVTGSLQAVDPQIIDDVLAQTQARQEASMQSALSDPFPSLTGIWGKQTYSNAAYWVGDQTQRETADAYMIECDQDPTLWDAKISGPSGDIESDEGNGHWEAYLFARIYLLYSSQSSYYPGRMSAAAEDAVVSMLWRWAKGRTKIEHADPAAIHYYWDSENHHAQGWVSMWSAAQVFVLDPDYQNLSYNDGTPVTTMATALDEYFKAYCRDRALKGLTLEINAPTYAKYTLNTWLNLYDFATDPELKKRVGMLLDIYWADHAIENIGGRRGGSRHRSYPHENSVTGASAGDHRMMLLGYLGDPGTAKHPGAMSAVTTTWRPSRAVIGMIHDNAERGTFTYTSRRLGRKDSSPAAPEPPAVGDHAGFNAFDPDGGSLLRTTWVTPEFVMGMSQVELRPTSDWVAVSTQNRWNGVMFSGDPNARIYTVPVYPDDKAYNAEWGVHNKGVMVVQRITESSAKYGPLGQKIWFDDSLARSETSGWIFAVSDDAYAGVYVVDGGYVWETSAEFPNHGIYADLNNQFSPIIIEVAAQSDYASFTEFRLEMISNSNAMSWDGTRLDYTSTHYDTTLTLFADESAPPRVDGVPNNMTPAKTYDSPYLQGEWAGGPVIIQYGDDRIIHAVAPFADDAGCLGLWHFDSLVGTEFADDNSNSGRSAAPAIINASSTDSVSLIADGVFGSAVRCDFETGDQYMMTGGTWPAGVGQADPVQVLNVAEYFDDNDTDGLFTSTLANFEVIDDPNAKLVVTLGYELSGPQVTSITYGGVALTPAITTGTGNGNNRDADIYYLDDPTPGTADIVVTWDTDNRQCRIGAASLGNAADGVSFTVDAAGANTDTLSTDVTTIANETLVIAVGNKNNNGSSFSTVPYAPENIISSGNSNSSYTSSGYIRVPAPATNTYTYTLAAADGVDAAFAGFASAGTSFGSAGVGAIKFQGWFRLNPGDTGGMIFHIHDQVSVSVDTSEVTFSINRSGNLNDTSATNFISLNADIATDNEWQYLEATYNGDTIQLLTELETVTAPGIGAFIPNNRSIYIGSRKNESNYVGDLDELKVSTIALDPVVVAATANHLNSPTGINTISAFSPSVGANTKLVFTGSWESGSHTLTDVTYAGLPFTEVVTSSTDRHSSIWYLDLDESSPTTGDVVATFSGSIDSRIGVMSLQNAAPGDPTQQIGLTGVTTFDITPSVSNSLVVGVYTENGSAALSSNFSNTLYSGDSGSSVGNAGYQLEPTPGTKTYTWTAANSSSALAAAVFAPASFSLPEPVDYDSDQLDDSYEVEVFGSLGVSDGTVDTDGDRFSDFAEFNWGTNPTDGTSFFKVTDVSNTTLNWAGVQGKTYTVYKKTSLMDPTWTVEATGVPGSPETVFPVSSSDSEAFFMIELE